VDKALLLDPTAGNGEAITESREGIPYIAYSHVWAHDLGSSADDSHPNCRLEYLLEMIDSPDETGLAQRESGLIQCVFLWMRGLR
jgi:hypothetical protein